MDLYRSCYQLVSVSFSIFKALIFSLVIRPNWTNEMLRLDDSTTLWRNHVYFSLLTRRDWRHKNDLTRFSLDYHILRLRSENLSIPKSSNASNRLDLRIVEFQARWFLELSVCCILKYSILFGFLNLQWL